MDPWETQPAEGEQTSVWKKDLSFRRKPKPADDVVETPADAGERKPSRSDRRAESRLAKSEAKLAKSGPEMPS